MKATQINELFNEKFGKEWAQFKGTKMFRFLEHVMDANNPLKKNAKRTPVDMINAGHIFASESNGYQQLQDLLCEELGLPLPKPPPTESDYSEPEV